MISPRPPDEDISRRDFARSSSRLRSEESSIHSGASASSLQALITFGQEVETWPLRSLSAGRPARDAMKRWASSVSDISSEKNATGFFAFQATFSAMLQTSADL